jgi:hypothetical protein
MQPVMITSQTVHGARAIALAANGFPDTSNAPENENTRRGGIVRAIMEKTRFDKPRPITAGGECRSNNEEKIDRNPWLRLLIHILFWSKYIKCAHTTKHCGRSECNRRQCNGHCREISDFTLPGRSEFRTNLFFTDPAPGRPGAAVRFFWTVTFYGLTQFLARG